MDPTARVRCTSITSFAQDLVHVSFTDATTGAMVGRARLRGDFTIYAHPERYVVGQIYELALPTPVQS